MRMDRLYPNHFESIKKANLVGKEPPTMKQVFDKIKLNNDSKKREEAFEEKELKPKIFLYS